MTIGAFARRSRLSLKALRLYDALGLLEPARVDSASGYRYYEESQLERAKLIGLLRQLEMPLPMIAEVLELGGPSAARAIGAYWSDIEADVRVKRKLVSYVRDYLEEKGESMYEVETRDIPEQKVLTIQRAVFVKDLPAFIEASFGRLFAHIHRGAKVAGPSMVLYHGQVNDDSDGPVEVCVPFSGSLEPVEEMRVRLEPAHREAFTRLTKAQVEFPGILKAYDAVGGWIQTNGLKNTGSPREVYFDDFMKLKPDDPACDIAFPYED
jgi:DNA-binding transcriptional MerR regulator